MKNPKITQDEIGIIKRAQAGDMLAFNKLFHKYKGFVDNILYGYIKDKDEAKDITNIVFLKVYDKLSTFTAYESFGGWLRTVTNHIAVDYLRKTKNNDVVIDSISDRLSQIDSPSNMENDLVNHFLFEQLMEELKKYPEQTQLIYEMRYLDNLKVEEISNALNVPVGTIKSILSRTRKRIQKHFKTT